MCLNIMVKSIGVYKDANGKIFAVKPICTHLGCLLSWNNLDKTWIGPCMVLGLIIWGTIV